MKRFFNARRIPLIATTSVCALLYIVAAAKYPGFASLRVFINFFTDNSFLGIIAVGMTLVIISGGIDLSVGAVMALCSIIIALMIQHHIPPVIAIAAALGIGAALGSTMGYVIKNTRMEPFIVTLAGMFFARGLAQIIHIEAMPIQSPFYSWISSFGLQLGEAFIPITAMIFVAVVVWGVYVTVYTPFGRNLYAVGGNEQAALLMGLPVGKTKLWVYTISGLCSALAAVVFTFYQSAGNPSAGVGMELDAIAVVVIGGTLLSGGAGHVLGTLVGTLIFGIIQTGITFQGTLSSWWTKVVIGVLLLAFIVLQKIISRGSER